MVQNNSKGKGCCLLSSGIFFCVLGLPLLIIGIVFNFVFQDVTEKMTQQTTAHVVELIPTQNDDGDNTHKIVAQYEVGGESYQATTSYSTSELKKGDDVTVCYDPLNPGNGAVSGPPVLRKFIKVLLIVGVVFESLGAACILICIYFAIKAKSRKTADVEIPAETGYNSNNQQSSSSFIDSSGKEIDPWEIK